MLGWGDVRLQLFLEITWTWVSSWVEAQTCCAFNRLATNLVCYVPAWYHDITTLQILLKSYTLRMGTVYYVMLINLYVSHCVNLTALSSLRFATKASTDSPLRTKNCFLTPGSFLLQFIISVINGNCHGWWSRWWNHGENLFYNKLGTIRAGDPGCDQIQMLFIIYISCFVINMIYLSFIIYNISHGVQETLYLIKFDMIYQIWGQSGHFYSSNFLCIIDHRRIDIAGLSFHFHLVKFDQTLIILW